EAELLRIQFEGPLPSGSSAAPLPQPEVALSERVEEIRALAEPRPRFQQGVSTVGRTPRLELEEPGLEPGHPRGPGIVQGVGQLVAGRDDVAAAPGEDRAVDPRVTVLRVQ